MALKPTRRGVGSVLLLLATKGRSSWLVQRSIRGILERKWETCLNFSPTWTRIKAAFALSIFPFYTRAAERSKAAKWASWWERV